MKIKKKSQFALVGHGFHLNFLFDELIKNKFPKPIIITHPKKLHLRDIKKSQGDFDLYRSVFELEKKTKVFYLKDINSLKGTSILKKNKIDYIFSLSSRFIFKSKIVSDFKNKIFNIHPSILPEEKGGGTFTYRILNKKNFCAATIHLINEEIDAGPILLQSKKEKLKIESLPIDYLKHTNLIYKSLIRLFVNKITKNNKFILKSNNKSKGWYLPRFYTDLSGLINWSWSGENVNLFIKACSKPYTGAFCFLKHKNKDLKITIYNSSFKKNIFLMHPWFNGKIFYEDKNIIKVFVKPGIINIKKSDIRLDNKVTLKKFLGKTLYSYPEDLTNSISNISNIFKYKL